MADELLTYYNRELTYVRRLGAEFAAAHPDIAGRLRLDADACDDPHVERMIEAFAYLTARLRHKLDDEFPEVTDAMLNVLYPHFLAPVPSMAIVQMTLGAGQEALVGGYTVPRHKGMETEPVGGNPVQFRTCMPTTLWPIKVVEARLGALGGGLPDRAMPRGALAVLHLRLQTLSDDVPLEKLQLDRLRFYLQGQRRHVNLLYELMLNHSMDVVLASAGPEKDAPDPVALGASSLQPAGFAPDEAALPDTPHTMPGYRLLTEYFAMPEKFLFVDIDQLGGGRTAGMGRTLDVYIPLDRTSTDLEHQVSASTFRLGCTPVINLFKHRADPIELDHAQLAYRVNPDARHPDTMEVYSIDTVTGGGKRKGDAFDYQPFFGIRHDGSADDASRRYWYSERRAVAMAGNHVDGGTDVFMSFVDLDYQPIHAHDQIVHVETTCLNRDLPSQLPFGGGQPRLSMPGAGVVGKIECLSPPTPTLRPPLRRGALWRAISQLNLNHLSLTDGERGADALREILRLYDRTGSADARSRIDGIQKVASKRAVFRSSRDMPGAFCRGTEIHIEFDEDRYSDGGLFLFSTLIEHFLGHYCSINTFTRMVATTRQRTETMRRWAPRAGDRILV